MQFTTSNMSIDNYVGSRRSPCGTNRSLQYLTLSFFKDETAATAIAAGIAVAIIAVVQGLGTKLTSTFSTVSTALK